jgi:hypothetical protein
MNDSNVEFYKSLWQDSFNFEFTAACRKGRFDEIRSILNHPELKKRVQFSYNDYECLTDAAFYRSTEIVKYLTSSPELTDHIDIQVKSNYALKISCENGNLELIKYILTDQNLKNRPSIHVHNDIVFQIVCENSRLNIVKYFLFDQNMEKTKEISEYLESHTYNPFVLEVMELFKKRDLAFHLEEDLSSDKITAKRLKL